MPGTHFISLEQAKAMTLRYQVQKSNVLKPELVDENILLTCETFDRTAFDILLAQDGCTQLRIYFGMDAQLTVKIIAVAVDANGKDILPSTVIGGVGGPDDDKIVEEGRPCPPHCPDPPLSLL